MGNLYNMINGVNPATFYILPMLGNHPDWYPRFRDCWVENGQIAVLTRVGSLNKNSGYEEEKLYNHPEYIKDIDYPEDNTYGIYYFKVPEKWKTNFDILTKKTQGRISEDYIKECQRVYPKIADRLKQQLESF